MKRIASKIWAKYKTYKIRFLRNQERRLYRFMEMFRDHEVFYEHYRIKWLNAWLLLKAWESGDFSGYESNIKKLDYLGLSYHLSY